MLENERSGKQVTQEVHLRDYLMVLYRHKWTIIALVIVTLASTVFYQRRQIPAYQARATIMIEPRRAQEMIFAQSVQAISIDLETQMEVIKTTPVLASVVKKLELTAAPEGTPQFSGMVMLLRDSISIGFVRNTKMLTITARHPNPERAQAIANAVAQAYIDQDRLSRLQTGRDAVKWLSTQLADLKTKLKTSEEAFQRFKEREGIISLDEERSAELQEISQLNASYLSTRSSRMEIETITNKLESETHTPGEESIDLGIPIALLNSPALQKLGEELSGLQNELTDKRRLFKDKYPGIISLRERIQVTEQKILEELKRQRDFLQAQEESFLALQEARHQEALKLSRKELEYLALERETITNREMYNTLLTKIGELSLAGEADLNNIRIVEPAELPIFPTGGKRLTLILGGALGLFLGVGFAFFLTYLENTIKTPDDVEQHLGLPVLGIVPQVAEARRVKTPVVVLNGDPRSAPAEAYRGLRTNLLFSDVDSPKKTIVITSAGPGEGKSITTVNLGMVLTQAGQRVLMVDADLRRPMLHRVFGTDRHNGLSAVLAEELTIDEAIVELNPKLSILASGVLPADPSQALGSQQMKDVISYAREHYDVVLFDSAPVLGISDTLVLASETDGTVLVIKPGEATRKALKMTVDQLEQVGTQVCGVVLNNVNVRRDKYYYKYQYYHYPYYSDDEDKKSRKK